MKTFTGILSVLFLLATAAYAAAPAKSEKWLDDFTAAKAAAKKDGRPILANFTGSDWCPWCIKLEKEIFSQKAFQDYASSNVVLFMADFPRQKHLPPKVQEQNEKLQAEYKIQGFPTVLLLDADGQVIGQTGYQKGGAEPFVANLKELIQKAGLKP